MPARFASAAVSTSVLFHREGPLACLPVWTLTLLSVSVALCQRKAEGSISTRFPASLRLLPRKSALPRQGWPSSRHTWASRGAGPVQARPASTGNCPLRPVQSGGRSHRQRTQEKVDRGQLKGSSSESFGGRPDGRPECYGGSRCRTRDTWRRGLWHQHKGH